MIGRHEPIVVRPRGVLSDTAASAAEVAGEDGDGILSRLASVMAVKRLRLRTVRGNSGDPRYMVAGPRKVGVGGVRRRVRLSRTVFNAESSTPREGFAMRPRFASARRRGGAARIRRLVRRRRSSGRRSAAPGRRALCDREGRPATLATPLERAASLTRGLAGLWDRAEARARAAATWRSTSTSSPIRKGGAEVLRAGGDAARANRATVVATIDPAIGRRVGARERHHLFAAAPGPALARRRRQRRRRADHGRCATARARRQELNGRRSRPRYSAQRFQQRDLAERRAMVRRRDSATPSASPRAIARRKRR